SNPLDGTDESGLQFAQDQGPGSWTPLPRDPAVPPDTGTAGPIFLAPGEMKVVSVWNRLHGMCADGSCCDNLFQVSGTWLPSGNPAIGFGGSRSGLDATGTAR